MKLIHHRFNIILYTNILISTSGGRGGPRGGGGRFGGGRDVGRSGGGGYGGYGGGARGGRGRSPPRRR